MSSKQPYVSRIWQWAITRNDEKAFWEICSRRAWERIFNFATKTFRYAEGYYFEWLINGANGSIQANYIISKLRWECVLISFRGKWSTTNTMKWLRYCEAVIAYENLWYIHLMLKAHWPLTERNINNAIENAVYATTDNISGPVILTGIFPSMKMMTRNRKIIS